MNIQENKIAIQGIEGSFHHIAARLFSENKDQEVKGFDDFEGLALDLVYKNSFGLMAIENSLVGSLMDNYRILHKYDIHVVGEIYLRIEQNLLALPGAEISDIREVLSHPMALAQCSEFFHQHPNIRLVETEDTAKSAAIIAKTNDKKKAAIASTLASEIYNLNIVARSIETNKQNYTRFLALSKKPFFVPAQKASISFTLKHKPGSLHNFMEAALRCNLNLTKIQSVPVVGQPWRYRFFVDLVSSEKLTVQDLKHIFGPKVESFNILGLYAPGKHHNA